MSVLAAFVLLVGSALSIVGVNTASAVSTPTLNLTLDMEDYTPSAGSVNGVDGWATGGCAVYDHHFELLPDEIKALAPGFGQRSFRVSNAVLSGCFDGTYTKSLANEAGETAAENGGKSGGVRSAYYEVEWQMISAKPDAVQPGLFMSFSPDRGDGARMSYIRVEDHAEDLPDYPTDGLYFYFDDFHGGDFDEVQIAGGVSRNQVHTIKISMVFVDGQTANDIVRVYFDNTLVHTGTSWENYFKEVISENPPSGNPPRTVDSLLLRTGSNSATSVSGVAGFGFYIDNIKLVSGLKKVYVQKDGDDALCDGTAPAAVTGSHVCAVQTVARGLQLAAISADPVDDPVEVNVGPGTYHENVAINKTLTLKGNNVGKDPRTGGDIRLPATETIIDGVASASTGTIRIGANNVVLDGLTITGGADSPVGGGVVFANAATGWKVQNTIITDNQIGMYPQCSTTCTIQKNLFDGNNQVGSTGGWGIYTDVTTTGLTITQNEFKNHTSNSSIVLASASGTVHHSPVISENSVHDNPGDQHFGPHTAFYLVKTENATVTANRISQPNGPAISLAGGNTGSSIQNNDLRYSHRGLRIQDVEAVGNNSGATVVNNAFGNNAVFGLSVIDGYTGTLTATNNWWGKASGPTNADNSGGTGAVVSGAVTFVPFLVKGNDTSALIGFQPATQPTLATVFVRDPAGTASDGNDSECNGSVDVAFTASPDQFGDCAVKTITRGAAIVPTPGIANTGIVSIAPGDYSETVTLTDKNDLTLKGSDANNRPVIQNGMVLGNHTNLTLQDLVVERPQDLGATIESRVVSAASKLVTNFTMTNVKIDAKSTPFRHGIASGQYAGNISITNSQFTNIKHWVAFDTGSGGTGTNIVNGTFSNNTITNTQGHVNFRSVASTTPAAVIQVTNNSWTGTGDFANGATANLKVFFAASATITGNTFKDVGTDHDGVVPGAPPASFSDELHHYGTAIMPRNVTNLVIQNNLFQDDNQAIAWEPINDPVGTDVPRTVISGGTIANNTFLNVKYGIYIPAAIHPSSTPANLIVKENSFVSNVAGAEAIHNGSSVAGNVTAIRNWWGSASGPTHATNANGTGSVVTNKVSFSPWLGDGTDTSGSIGFQPNLTPTFGLATQGINVAPTTGLVTTENGGQASFAVVLASAPTANVQIGLSSSNTNEGTIPVASQTLTFTPANWMVPQTVTVTGVAVGPANGDVAYSIVTAPAVSTDLHFSGINASDVSVTNTAAAFPLVSIADSSVTEGTGSTVQMTFNVTLSQTSPRTTSVQYAVQGQTATGNTDLPPPFGGTVTFNAGDTSKTIQVPIAGDSQVEGSETFLVNLSSPSGLTILDGQAVGTINDDDLAAQACVPRPNILLTTQAVGGRQQQVTVRADTTSPNGGNILATIQFEAPTNATVQMPGRANVGTSVINLSAGTRQVVFFVTQTNVNSSFLVPFTITDSCGSVHKFVGGGKDAIAN